MDGDFWKAAANHPFWERVNNPLLFGFVVSWCLWNYKFLVILFSENTVSTTFALINSISFQGWAQYLCNGLVFPLITTWAYVYVLPHPTRWVYGYQLRQQRASNALRQSIEEEALISREDASKILQSMRAQRVKHAEEVEGLRNEIEELTSANTRLEADFRKSRLEQDNTDTSSEWRLAQAQYKILKAFTEFNVKHEFSVREVVKLVGLRESLVLRAMLLLEQRGYVLQASQPGKDPIFLVTEAGIEFVRSSEFSVVALVK